VAFVDDACHKGSETAGEAGMDERMRIGVMIAWVERVLHDMGGLERKKGKDREMVRESRME
jgi:hypothetical protein